MFFFEFWCFLFNPINFLVLLNISISDLIYFDFHSVFGLFLVTLPTCKYFAYKNVCISHTLVNLLSFLIRPKNQNNEEKSRYYTICAQQCKKRAKSIAKNSNNNKNRCDMYCRRNRAFVCLFLFLFVFISLNTPHCCLSSSFCYL